MLSVSVNYQLIQCIGHLICGLVCGGQMSSDVLSCCSKGHLVAIVAGLYLNTN